MKKTSTTHLEALTEQASPTLTADQVRPCGSSRRRAARLLLALPLLAPIAAAVPWSVLFSTINSSGTLSRIHIGEELSLQAFHSDYSAGQFYPTAEEPADMGVFVRTGGTLYAPNFGAHTAGSATGGLGTYTPWTPVALGAVTGTGSGSDPYQCVVDVTAGSTGLDARMTVSYRDADDHFRHDVRFSNTSGSAITFDVFLGSDLYLAGQDTGICNLVPTPCSTSPAVGGRDCGAGTFNAFHNAETPADRLTGTHFSTVWSQIGAGLLDNALAVGCIDNGAALQWQNRTLEPGEELTILSTTCFGSCQSACDCMFAVIDDVQCDPTGSGDVSLTLTVTNNSGITAHSLEINDPNITPSSISLGSGLSGNGGTQTVNLTVQNAVPLTEYCFDVSLFDLTVGAPACDSEEICFTVPDCVGVAEPCMVVVADEILCAPDGSGKILYTFTVTNNSGIDAYNLAIPDLNITPNVTPLSGISGAGGTVQVSILIDNATPFTEYCFDMVLFGLSGQPCCSTLQHCLEIPGCGCGQIRDVTTVCTGIGNDYRVNFTLDNFSSVTIDHAFLTDLPSGISADDNFLPLGGVAPGDSVELETIISGAALGEEVCFTIHIHDQTLLNCCDFEVCVTGPSNCDPIGWPTDLTCLCPGDAVARLTGDPAGSGGLVTTVLEDAPANAAALFIAGFQGLGLPILDGILVPFPEFIVPVATDAEGGFELDFGISSLSMMTLYLQFVVVDPTQPQQFGFSNGLRLDVY